MNLKLSNKEIAQRLGNSEATIKSHVSAILEKFGAKNRMDLLLRNPPQGRRASPPKGILPWEEVGSTHGSLRRGLLPM